ncbi:hypothetical protein HDU79_006065 [Rhizoclosmatium sp. JEL0117]|nr:hypothetical protein HDU79_006065 [Rhizoclosmatium sp. JEL0117]
MNKALPTATTYKSFLFAVREALLLDNSPPRPINWLRVRRGISCFIMVSSGGVYLSLFAARIRAESDDALLQEFYAKRQKAAREEGALRAAIDRLKAKVQ